jgi:CRISPR-associated endonuclease/helicase Cas3
MKKQNWAEDILLSHPDRLLARHIAEVEEGCLEILGRHSAGGWLGTSEAKAMTQRLARLHDLGKGAPAFQRYIRDPKGYKKIGRDCEKAHTPMSFFLSLALLKAEGAGFHEIFALTQAALGHHTRLRTKEELLCVFDTDDKVYPVRANFPKMDRVQLAEAAQEKGLLEINALEPEEMYEEFEGYLEEIERMGKRDLAEALAYRVRVQALFSVLLEADKAYLIMSRELYKKEQKAVFSLDQLEEATAQMPKAPLSSRRELVRQQIVQAIGKREDAGDLEKQGESKRGKIEHLILPTGMGKTLTAASWALSWRERTKEEERKPKVIVVLPFLSVIEQTEAVYRQVLGIERQGAMLMASHSLSERVYDSEAEEGIRSEEAAFFLDTWRSEIIITTYDQLLLAIFSPKTRYQMRFHQTMDALIILDELQCLPCKLWEPIAKMFSALVAEGNTRILAMSATLPPFLEGSQSLLSQEQIEAYRRSFGRYRIHLGHRKSKSLEELAEELVEEMPRWEEEGLRILVTLNTRASARSLRDRLAASWSGELLFLSADVTPRDRLAALQRLREIEKAAAAGQRSACLVISTQCVEAGVDLDMDEVYRDLAPLDSIIQIAGRCNRHANRERGNIYLFQLHDDKKKPYAERIYDKIHLEVTRTLLLQYNASLDEEEVGGAADQYFALLQEKKDTGRKLIEDFARWEGEINIRKELRGDQSRQITFLIVQQAPVLREKLQEALGIADRWERRAVLRQLAPEIAAISVTVYTRKGFDPMEIAEECGLHYLLTSEELYTSARGLDLAPTLGEGEGSTFDF